MTRAGGKAPTQIREKVALDALERLSKAALIDLVVDLVRRVEEDEALDGTELVLAVTTAFEPIAAIRGDREVQW